MRGRTRFTLKAPTKLRCVGGVFLGDRFPPLPPSLSLPKLASLRQLGRFSVSLSPPPSYSIFNFPGFPCTNLTLFFSRMVAIPNCGRSLSRCSAPRRVQQERERRLRNKDILLQIAR